MDDYKRLNHSVWECKYHVVFIPKYRRKLLYGGLRRELGKVLRTLARQKGCEVEEDNLLPDSRPHVDIDSTKAFGCTDRWVHQREERNPRSACPFRSGAQFRWPPLLGTRVLCIHGGSG